MADDLYDRWVNDKADYDETTVAVRKLLESKDAAVRAAMLTKRLNES
jgi:hypothetical protein